MLSVRPRGRVAASLALTAGLLALAPSCGGGGGSGTSLYVVQNTDGSVAPTGRVFVAGGWMIYFAGEFQMAMDLNGDGDMVDQVAQAVNMFSFAEMNIGVAALDVAALGNEIYLAVDESLDGVDWSGGNGLNDIVLLNWSEAAGMATFVEVLDATAAPYFTAVSTRLYYPAEASPMAGETSLHYIDGAMPLVPVTVMHTDMANSLELDILGEDEGLLFLTQDETSEMRDLNGDLDMADMDVLALLDATDPAAMVMNVGLAVDDSSPIRADNTAANDWTVAFLVNEADQGGVSLNDPMDPMFPLGWFPAACTMADVDTTDEVLHYLEFAAWSMDPMMNPPTNTGLAGESTIVAVDGYVGTVSSESDQANCDLNFDTDTSDHVVQYIGTGAMGAPQTTVTLLVAVDTTTPGGSGGFASEDDIFVIPVDEADQNADINGDGDMNDRLFGWHDPAQAMMTSWVFDHDASAGNSVYVGVEWMASRPDRERTLVALQEEVFDPTMSINNTDMDVLDSVPTFTRRNFSGSMVSDLDFPGVAVALNTGAPGAGIVDSRNILYYRVNETEDNFDWNFDGDILDDVLLRTSTTNGATVATSTLNSVTNTLAVVTDDQSGAAFIADEVQAGQDYNGDGDTNDLVVRWFRIQ